MFDMKGRLATKTFPLGIVETLNYKSCGARQQEIAIIHNINHRLYNPAVGRFLSSDPVVKDPGNSQHYNRYSYCLNNPLKYTDPSGYTQAQMWTNEMTESMLAGLSGWATAFGYTVSNGIGSSSGDGFVGSSSSTPRLDKEKSTEALDVVGSLLNNPDGGYWSRSKGLMFFESNVSAVVFSGSTRNHYIGVT